MSKTLKAESIDVTATIAALREQAVARGKAMGLSADSTLDDPLRQAEDFAHVSAHFPLMWRVPVLGRGLSLVKRVVRILLRWYINPIVDQVNDFNAATVTALNTLAARQEALAARIAALELGEPHPPAAQRAPASPSEMERGSYAANIETDAGPVNVPSPRLTPDARRPTGEQGETT